MFITSVIVGTVIFVSKKGASNVGKLITNQLSIIYYYLLLLLSLFCLTNQNIKLFTHFTHAIHHFYDVFCIRKSVF